MDKQSSGINSVNEFYFSIPDGVIGFFIDIGGWSEKFSLSTIDGNNIGKIFS
jgi:hypothetical protein